MDVGMMMVFASYGWDALSSLGTFTIAIYAGLLIVLLGVYHGHLPFSGVAGLVKELTLVNAMAYGRRDGVREVEEAAALLARDPAIPDVLITHRFPLADAAEAYRALEGRETTGKLILVP